MWLGWLAAAALGSDSALWLRNLRAVDAAGPRDIPDLLIEDGRIVALSAPDPSRGLVPTDLEGRTVTPGLVDAHVHLSMIPSGAHLQRSRPEEHALWARHLAAYVASGVTSVLDTGIREDDAYVIRALADAGPSPDVYFLGPLLSPPGGYVSVVLPDLDPVATAAQVAEQIAFFAPLDPVGIKVTFEEGMLTRVWPLYPDPVVRALQDPVVTRGLPLMAHAMAPREYRMALEVGVAAFVHPPQSTPRWLVDALVAQGTPVVSTLSVFDSLLLAAEPERMDHPMFQTRVPPEELAAARDEAWLKASSRRIVEHMLPGSPRLVHAAAARAMGARSVLRSRVRRMQRAVRALHEAGVPIVMGSDSGNWPLFAFEFHGPTSIRELELLVEAGLPPQDAIEAATLHAARLLGAEDRLGRIAPGMQADLVVLDRDPLADITAFRSPAWVIQRGVMKTPQDWLSGE